MIRFLTKDKQSAFMLFQCQGLAEAMKCLTVMSELLVTMKKTVDFGVKPEPREITVHGNEQCVNGLINAFI